MNVTLASVQLDQNICCYVSLHLFHQCPQEEFRIALAGFLTASPSVRKCCLRADSSTARATTVWMNTKLVH